MKTAASWSFVVAILVGTGLGTLAVYDVAHKYFAQGSLMGEFGGRTHIAGSINVRTAPIDRSCLLPHETGAP